MGERIVVSGDGGVCAYACPPGKPLESYVFCGAGAVCAGKDGLFVSCDQENAIWRLDRKTLERTGAFQGGPGMAQIMTSSDGKRLYVLCSEADSLLMLDAKGGTPQVLSRVGVNPCAMAMDEREETIAVAGGGCGDVLLLGAHSLSMMGKLGTCGMVFSVAVSSGVVYALSLTETMDSVLTSFLPDGRRRELPLSGMPGALCVRADCVAAATHQGVFFAARDGSALLGRLSCPGRAGRLWMLSEGILMTDLWTDALFWRGGGISHWVRIAEGVRDAVCV